MTLVLSGINVYYPNVYISEGMFIQEEFTRNIGKEGAFFELNEHHAANFVYRSTAFTVESKQLISISHRFNML